MATSNGAGMAAGVNTSVPAGYSLRIQPEAFLGFIATFLIIAVVSAAARTAIRFYHLRRLYADDYFLFYAVLAAGAAAGVAYSIKDLVYEQIYVGLGWEQLPPNSDFVARMLVFEQRVQVCSILIWSCIYAIKLSFLCLFRKLVDKVRVLEIHWWLVTGITIVCGLTSMPLAFIVCPNFTPDYMEYCRIEFQLSRERIYLDITSALDIFTDVLIISIPVALLWKVRISLRRKLTLGSMLCLSAAMIAMTIVRTSLAPLPSGVIDTSWLVFWQGIEAATAVIVVSISAFRNLFGREGSRASKRSKRLQYRRNSGGPNPGNSDQNQNDALLERPAPAKARPMKFFRYKGESVMDEESQAMTTYDVTATEYKENDSHNQMMGARLDKPFSSDPRYSAVTHH